MARSYFDQIVLSSSGALQRRAPVYVYEADGVTPLAQTMYSAASGGTVLTNPLVSDDQGHVEAYADDPQAIVVKVGAVERTAAFTPIPFVIPRARVYYTASQNVSDNSETAIQYNTVRHDSVGLFDFDHNTRLTATIDGLYRITGNVRVSGGSAGDLFLSIRLNGVTADKIGRTSHKITSAVDVIMEVSTEWLLVADDYVELTLAPVSYGATAEVKNDTKTSPEFMMSWICA